MKYREKEMKNSDKYQNQSNKSKNSVYKIYNSNRDIIQIQIRYKLVFKYNLNIILSKKFV